MHKIYKIAGIMLVAGVLVMGIGSGVAFAEYSAFEYGGEAVLEGSERFTKTLQYKVDKETQIVNEKQMEKTTEVSIEEEQTDKMVDENGQQKEKEVSEDVTENELKEKKRLNIRIYSPHTIVYDSSVSKDMVQFTISYLSDNQDVKPEIIVENSEETQESIYLECDFRYNDFRDLMRVKDPILADLKNHRIRDYQLDKIEMIEVRVNPEAEFDMHINEY